MGKGTKYVAVYGTLMRGEHNECWREGIGTVTEGVMFGKLFDTGWGFPAFAPAEDELFGSADDRVRCEVLAVTAKELAHMDVLEGYPRLYRRENVTVHGMDDEDYECLVYVMNAIPKRATEITSGDWRSYRKRMEGVK